MSDKNSFFINIKISSLIFFGFIILLFAACQKSPTNEVVINKGNGELESKILEKAEPSETWMQTENKIIWEERKIVNTEIGDLSVKVNINVDTPKDPRPVSIYKIEPKELDMNFLISTAEYLLGEEMFCGEASKQDVTMEILNVKKELSAHTTIDSMKKEIENYFDFLNQKYINATEDNVKAKYEFTTSEYGQNNLRLKSYIDDKTIKKFTAQADNQGKCYGFIFRINEINRVYSYLNKKSGENIQAEGVNVTYEQALNIANNTIATIFDDPFAMVHTCIVDKVNDLEYLWNDGDGTSLEQAYVFCYSREYDGIPSLYIDPSPELLTEKSEYAEPYIREYVQLVVNDRGIAYMTYDSSSDVIEKPNDNVKLMPFEDVLERFKKEVFYHSLWGDSAEIAITQIKFGMVREPVKDNPDQYLMPAWNFIGDVKLDWVEEKEKSILALNAIDGSVITNYESIIDPK